MAEAILRAGWTVASIEYRRIPGEPDETLHDVSAALVKLPAVLRHNGNVVLVGHSARRSPGPAGQCVPNAAVRGHIIAPQRIFGLHTS